MKEIHLNIGGVPEHFNLPWYQALEENAFEAAGIRVNWQDYPGGTGAMAKDLRSGGLDVAVLLTEGIVADIAKGNPSRIIQVYVESPLLWGIHVPAGSVLYSGEDLAGKRYAISRYGSGSHLMAYVDARLRGQDPGKLELILVGDMAGAREAFNKGEADVFMWEKFMTKPLVDQGEFRRIGETPTPWPCFVIAARQEVIDRYPAALQQLLQVINRYSRNFKASPDAAVKQITNRFHLQAEDAATWLAATQWSAGGPVPAQMISQVAETLAQLKVIERVPEVGSLVYNSQE